MTPPPLPRDVTTAPTILPFPAQQDEQLIEPFDIKEAAALLEHGAQLRVALDDETVESYAALIYSGEVLPSPVAYVLDISSQARAHLKGEDLILADGFHRIAAQARAHIRATAALGALGLMPAVNQIRQREDAQDLVNALGTLWVELREGTRRDATLYAAGANTTHGLRPTPHDVRRAVEALLGDEEWMRWSDREIARRTGSSRTTVGRIRKELGAHADERIHVRAGVEVVQQVKAAPAQPIEQPAPSALDVDGDGQSPAPGRPVTLGQVSAPSPARPIEQPAPSALDVDGDGQSHELAEDEPADVYAVHREAVPPPRPVRRVYPAMVPAEEPLAPHLRHLIRRWVWTHGSRDGVPSVARLSTLPHALDACEDDRLFDDLDMYLGKLVSLGLLATTSAGCLRASRELEDSYRAANRRMAHIVARQDDWVQRRAEELGEQIGATQVLLTFPLPNKRGQIDAPNRIEIELGAGVELSAEAMRVSGVGGRAFEPAMAKLEAAVEALLGLHT